MTTNFLSIQTLLTPLTLERGWMWVAVLILLSSLLAIIYVWRVVEVAYFKPASDKAVAAGEAPLLMLVPTWALIVANVYFGMDTRLSFGVALRAAEGLMGTGP